MAEITGITTLDYFVISAKSIGKIVKVIVVPRICLEEPKKTRKHQSEYPVLGPKLEAGTSRIRGRTATQ